MHLERKSDDPLTYLFSVCLGSYTQLSKPAHERDVARDADSEGTFSSSRKVYLRGRPTSPFCVEKNQKDFVSREFLVFLSLLPVGVSIHCSCEFKKADGFL